MVRRTRPRRGGTGRASRSAAWCAVKSRSVLPRHSARQTWKSPSRNLRAPTSSPFSAACSRCTCAAAPQRRGVNAAGAVQRIRPTSITRRASRASSCEGSMTYQRAPRADRHDAARPPAGLAPRARRCGCSRTARPVAAPRPRAGRQLLRHHRFDDARTDFGRGDGDARLVSAACQLVCKLCARDRSAARLACEATARQWCKLADQAMATMPLLKRTLRRDNDRFPQRGSSTASSCFGSQGAMFGANSGVQMSRQQD